MRTVCPFAALFVLLPFHGNAQSTTTVPPSARSGYYIPVAPQGQSKPPCGHYGMAPCPTAPEPKANVTIPPNATADQVFDLGQNADRQRRFTVAAAYFEHAAEMGHTRAQAALGLMYYNAKGEPKDDKKAVYWLSKAAEKHHRVAESQMGEFYEHGTGGVEKNLPKAIAYYQDSANQHWWLSEYSLAIDYELGTGVPRNRQTAISLFNRAASDGHDGLSQDLSAMLQRPGTPRFSNVIEMAGYLNSLRGRPEPGPAGTNSFLNPSPGQQYIRNRMGLPGNTCGGPYPGSGCGH